MDFKVLYFTRTGNSKRIAEKIGSKLNSTVIEITDNKNWNGILGFIKGGFYSAVDKDVQMKLSGETNDASHFIVVTPLWAGGPAPAVRMFIKEMGASKINLVVSFQGSNAEKSIHKYERKVGKFNQVFTIKEKTDEDKIIDDIIKNL